MTEFTRKYLLWLLAPPFLVLVPLAFLFLAQVIHLTLSSGSMLLILLVVVCGASTLLVAQLVAPYATAVGEAQRSGGDLAKPMSSLLDRAVRSSLLAWTAGGVIFNILGTLLVLRTALGFSYFLVASMIVAFPATAWAYATTKRQMSNVASQADKTRYLGRQVSLGKKIAIVFIGSFILSAAVLIELISSKVSTTLERLAIASSAERFDRVFDSANILFRADAEALNTLREYVPREYSLHLIDKNGKVVSTKDPLTAAEAAAILQIQNGDSTSFISPHVSRFGRLKDGSILVLSIPWAPYANIPFQITFYTLIIALFTTAFFSVATFFLARDITTPMRELSDIATEMAQGNFDTATRVFSDDEVGQLAESFSETRTNLRRLLGRVGGSGATITDGVRVITGGTDSLLSHAREQAELTEGSTLAVENMRAGITGVLQAADTVTELTQDASARALELQASAEEVARSMDHLFQSVEKTSTSTTEMNASMNEMSRRTQVLAGIGEEVLSFVSQMDSTVGELRGVSLSTAEISRRVREDAEDGGAAVDRTVDGIRISQELTVSTAGVLDDLQRSVGKINQILTVIEDITNQTNLLALNAAIIAAQAGEHGLGFTVVADEIRQLAERTRGSTKEISDIIRAVQTGSRQAVAKMHEGVDRVKENVDLAQVASASLSKIVSSASQSYEMATKISRALDDQAMASRHLHDVTSRMSDHIAEINRATSEQARGTELLAHESELVRDIAAQVKNATAEQSQAGRGITEALEHISDDARVMREMLQKQLHETDRIADASRLMLDIAQENDAIAREFTATVQNLVQSGQEFESEVGRFRLNVQ